VSLLLSAITSHMFENRHIFKPKAVDNWQAFYYAIFKESKATVKRGMINVDLCVTMETKPGAPKSRGSGSKKSCVAYQRTVILHESKNRHFYAKFIYSSFFPTVSTYS